MRKPWTATKNKKNERNSGILFQMGQIEQIFHYPSGMEQIWPLSILINGQQHAGHGITIVAPISKKSHNQVGILFVDDINLLEGLDKDVNVASPLEKGQQGVHIWGRNLYAVGGELRPDKCSYTVHRMKPT